MDSPSDPPYELRDVYVPISGFGYVDRRCPTHFREAPGSDTVTQFFPGYDGPFCFVCNDARPYTVVGGVYLDGCCACPFASCHAWNQANVQGGVRGTLSCLLLVNHLWHHHNRCILMWCHNCDFGPRPTREFLLNLHRHQQLLHGICGTRRQQAYDEVENLMGPSYGWPPYYSTLFAAQDFDYRRRFTLFLFLLHNTGNVEASMNWILSAPSFARNARRRCEAYRHLSNVAATWWNGRLHVGNMGWSTWSVTFQRYEAVDGCLVRLGNGGFERIPGTSPPWALGTYRIPDYLNEDARM